MHRRAFIGTAASTLLLPACATTTARPAAQRGCLPPVNVAPERVIRTMAGLRPYRASGFVVRAEPLGQKRTVVPARHLKGQDDEQQSGQWRNQRNQSANAKDKE